MNKIQTNLKLLFTVIFLASVCNVWASGGQDDNEPESPCQEQPNSVLSQMPVVGSAYNSNVVQNALIPGTMGFTGGTTLALFVPPLAPFAPWVGVAAGAAASYYSWKLSDVTTLARDIKKTVYRMGKNLQEHREETAEGFRNLNKKVDERSEEILTAVATEASRSDERHRQVTAQIRKLQHNQVQLRSDMHTGFNAVHGQGEQNRQALGELNKKVDGLTACAEDTNKVVRTIAGKSERNWENLDGNNSSSALAGTSKAGFKPLFAVKNHPEGMMGQFMQQAQLPTYCRSLRSSLKPHSGNQDFSTNPDSRNLFK